MAQNERASAVGREGSGRPVFGAPDEVQGPLSVQRLGVERIRALSKRPAGTSLGLDTGEDLAFLQRVVNRGAGHVPPCPRLFRAVDQNVDR